MLQSFMDVVTRLHPMPLEPFEVWLLALVGVVLLWLFVDLAVDSAWALSGVVLRHVRRRRVRRVLEATASARGVDVSRSPHGRDRDTDYGSSTSLIVTDPDAPKDINHIERLR